MTALQCEKEASRPDHMGVSRVWCSVNDIMIYEMSYESLFCCYLVEIEI